MSKDTKRLGKGIEALFSSNMDLDVGDIADTLEEIDGYQIREIGLDKMRANPYQPRKTFDETALNELAMSIKEHGIIQPIVVRKSLFGYDILAGERRYRAAKIAGMDSVPVVIKNFDEEAMMELAVLENIQREDLNIIEEAKGYEMLLDKLGWTQQVLADRMGKSRVHVTNVVRLLRLPTKVQDLLEKQTITMGHAKVLIGLEDELIYDITDAIVKDNLSVRETERIAQRIKETPKQEVNPTEEKQNEMPEKKDVELSFVEGQLIQYLGTKVDITNRKIMIDYQGDAELNRILEVIGLLEREGE